MDDQSKVYILVDEECCILRCDGGYTIGNVDESRWILIDAGDGDRFNLCQSHYFEGGLYTEDGICRYKYVEGECVLRSETEMDYDRYERDNNEQNID